MVRVVVLVIISGLEEQAEDLGQRDGSGGWLQFAAHRRKFPGSRVKVSCIVWDKWCTVGAVRRIAQGRRTPPIVTSFEIFQRRVG